MYCPKCGKPVSAGSNFCANCGYSLSVKSTATSNEQELLQKQASLFELQTKKENLTRRIRESEKQQSTKLSQKAMELSDSEFFRYNERLRAEMDPLYKQLEDVEREIKQLLGQ